MFYIYGSYVVLVMYIFMLQTMDVPPSTIYKFQVVPLFPSVIQASIGTASHMS